MLGNPQTMMMMKRRATDEAPGASPSKRLHLNDAASLYLDDDGDDIFTPTPTTTPSSVADVDSPVTAATTPRAKFPSDYKTLACTWPGCTKSFNRPARLRDHLNSHTNSRPHKCPYDGCDKDYIEDKHLKQHIKAVHTHERKHVCQRAGCGKSFVTGTRLKRHQAVHEGADRFRCRDCGQSFRKKETLNKHVRKEHQGLPAHQCPEAGCAQAFDSKAALHRHRDREHGEPKYWCGECGPVPREDGTAQRVGFTTDALLQAHMKLAHQNCLFCDYKSSSQWELETHVEIHHSGKTVEDRKNVSCPYDNCRKKFTKKSNLNVHIRTAHQGFRFVCGEVDLAGPGLDGWSNDRGCGDKFSTKVRLEDHVRFIHLGQERPKLSRTDRAGPADLIDELSGVANEKKQTIPCPHCDEAFIRYYDLDIHMTRVHDPALNADAVFAGGTVFNTNGISSTFLTQGDDSHHHQLHHHHPPFIEEDDSATHSAWPPDDSMPQEEIFAAQMDYGPPQDDWLEDEANILLLARGGTSLDLHIDPTLGGF